MSLINEISLDKLISEISSNDDVIFFVGSAISMFEPTNIPSGNALKLNIFSALTNIFNGKDLKSNIFNDSKKENKFNFLSKYYKILEPNKKLNKEFLNIPLERILSYIWSILDESKKEEFFNCINLFINAPPNGFHEILADITSKNAERFFSIN